MKTIILFIAVSAISLASPAQPSEFTIHDNGLIYDETTMSRLGNIVDSLNIRFRSCEAKNFKSLSQGFATYIVIPGDAKKVKAALNEKISVDELLKLFPDATVFRDQWIIKTFYNDYQDKPMIEYFSLPRPKNNNKIEIDLPRRISNNKTTGWVYSTDEDETEILFLQGLKELPLAPEYARLVQYVDCMIDTTAEIYTAERSTFSYQKTVERPKLKEFITWANRFPGEPKFPKVDSESPYSQVQYEKYYREHERWNNERLASLDQRMKTDQYHKNLLAEAADEAIEDKISTAELEYYTERYLSPELALQLKRSRRPVGMCSMDRSPRYHAATICRLAAETAQWDIFLRAHLDIMNDRFDRVSDGSYAWAGRGTYLKELEQLDINALDLLIGTTLRSSNTSSNHYFGDISRIGRALSETSFNTELETRLLAMIRDEQLDLYNRLLIAYLFKNYNHYLKDEGHKKLNEEKLAVVVENLPFDLPKSLSEW